MKRFEKILFIYSIIALTSVSIAFGLFEPKPINLISSVALFPLIVYFWIRVSNPERVSVVKWSIQLLLIIVVLSGIGVYGEFLSRIMNKQVPQTELESVKTESNQKITELEDKINKLEEENKNNEKLEKELTSIKEELSRLNDEGNLTLGASQSKSLADLLSEFDNQETITPLGYVKVKDEVTTPVSVYENANLSSNKISSIEKGTNYEYTESNGTWYKINYQGSLSGWVHEKDIEVVKDQ